MFVEGRSLRGQDLGRSLTPADNGLRVGGGILDLALAGSLVRQGGVSAAARLQKYAAVERAGFASAATTERAGFGAIAPYASRTPNLPEVATMAQMLENKWIPHVQGITITDRTIRFADMFRLSQAANIEFGLTKELMNGRAVYRLYSGGPNALAMPGIRNIGHTHPSGNQVPSNTDIRSINEAFLDAVQSNPLARLPHRRVIWGSGPADSTFYYPNVLR